MNFEKVDQFLHNLEKDYFVPSAELAVYQDHRLVYRGFAGFSDAEKTKKTDGSDTYFLYSTTKVITSTVAMRLVEQGKMALDNPVAKYLPEYANVKISDGNRLRPAGQTMRIWHLLSMQGGFSYDLGCDSLAKALKEDPHLSTREAVRALAGEPLLFEPGTHFKYSLCHDVLAVVCEVAGGKPFSTLVQDEIFTPLGMKNSVIGNSRPDLNARLSALYDGGGAQKMPREIGKDNVFFLTDAYESGGAGLISTVDDYALLADALANGGVSKDGYRVLTEDSIAQMQTNRLGSASMQDFQRDFYYLPGYGYGLGVRTKMKNLTGHDATPIGEFGWDGAAGALVVISPETHVSFFYAQHILGSLMHNLHPKLKDLVFEAIQ